MTGERAAGSVRSRRRALGPDEPRQSGHDTERSDHDSSPHRNLLWPGLWRSSHCGLPTRTSEASHSQLAHQSHRSQGRRRSSCRVQWSELPLRPDALRSDPIRGRVDRPDMHSCRELVQTRPEIWVDDDADAIGWIRHLSARQGLVLAA